MVVNSTRPADVSSEHRVLKEEMSARTLQKNKFIKDLKLSSETLNVLSKIIASVAKEKCNFFRFISNGPQEPFSAKKENQTDSHIHAVERVFLNDFANNLAVMGTSGAGQRAEIRLTPEEIKSEITQRVEELIDFDADISIIFQSRDFVKILRDKNLELAKHYQNQLKNSTDPEKVKKIESEVIRIKNEIRDAIEEHCNSLQEQPVKGLQNITNLFNGFKTKQLLESASDTHSMLLELKAAVKETARDLNRFVENPALRTEALRHIKAIQERTHELVKIEKATQGVFSTVFNSGKIKKLEKESKEIKKIVDNYYKELNFDNDFVAEHANFSIEAHRPKRQHLMNYAMDMLLGIRNVVEEEKQAIKQKIVRKYIRKNYRTEIKKLFKPPHSSITNYFFIIDRKLRLESEKMRVSGLNLPQTQRNKLVKPLNKKIKECDKKLDKKWDQAVQQGLGIDLQGIKESYRLYMTDPIQLEIVLKDINANFAKFDSKTQNEMNLLNSKLTNLEKFETQITKSEANVFQHPAIGAGKPQENLSMDVTEWKRQQEAAKSAIQGIFDELKMAYISMTGSKKLISAVTRRFNQGRNEVLRDHLRWDIPIQRTIEFPAGLMGPMVGISGKNKVIHTMTCANAGYPSSSFRGREAGPKCIQPNLHRVDITRMNGESLASYTSSATNVEFFQHQAKERAAATLQQTGEILLGKVDRKLASLAPGEGKTPENPVTVDVMTTLLLSPDTLRGWLIEHPRINRLIGRFNHAFQIDASTLERRMLQESVKAWQAFDESTPVEEGDLPKTFIIQDKENKFRKLVGDVDAEGKRVFYSVASDEKGEEIGERTYVRFNISTYNTGCNQWTKNMRSFKSGKSLETLAKKLLDIIPGLRGTYSGELGQEYEDKLNQAAFAKDTVRYNNKLNELKQSKSQVRQQWKDPTASGVDKVPEVVKEIEALIGTSALNEKGATGVRLKRKALLEAEQNYSRALKKPKPNKSEIAFYKMARNIAFAEWREARQKVASNIVRELNKPNLDPNTKKYLEILQHEENLTDIFNEVSDLFEFEHYKSEEGMKASMYTLPSALVTLGIELDVDPHTGCRSGKDRTSLQRMEIGTRILTKEAYGRYLSYREMDNSQIAHETREQMLLNSGHIDELAYLNTGSAGLNLSGGYGSYLKNFGAGGKVYPSWYENIILFGVKNVFAMRLK